MQQTFNDKYQDECKSKETKGEIFTTTLGPNESLEGYIEERFQLNYRRANCTLDARSLNIVLL